MMDNLISRPTVIDTNGLDEEIKCEMCRNPMHTDRGCDGNCKYDEKLYERIMQILGERIKPLLSAQLDVPDTNIGDTVYRQDAIDALCEYYCGGWNDCKRYPKCEYLKAIQQLSSAQPHSEADIQKIQDLEQAQIEKAFELGREKARQEPQWIPCSERLPECMDFVLLTVRRMDKSYNQRPFISVGYIDMNKTSWWCAHDGNCESANVEVIAWCELPEPYSEEGEQDE